MDILVMIIFYYKSLIKGGVELEYNAKYIILTFALFM